MIFLYLLIFLVTVAAVARLSYVQGQNKGFSAGKEETEAYWNKLKATPMVGQEVIVPGFGTVIVLGTGFHEGKEVIDFVSTKFLAGRNIPDVPQAELEANQAWTGLDQFVAQCELSLK